MQNIKMNVHDHMDAETMKSIFSALYEVEKAYNNHIENLKFNHEQTAEVKAEIRRATREMKKARQQSSSWAQRTITKKGEEIHGRNGNYVDNDYI